MLFDRSNWPPHRPWLILFLAGTFLAAGWFWMAARETGEWPGGRSLPGFTFGVVGGLIILFEMALWFRKKVRVWRIGRAQSWLRAHIWLGLLCLPLLVLHSGLRWGGILSTVLMVLLVIVVVSGVWGLVLQNLLPRKMLEQIPAETIYSQIDYLAGQLLAEAETLVTATCGNGPSSAAGQAEKDGPSTSGKGNAIDPVSMVGGPSRPGDGAFVVVGKVRSVGNVQGKVVVDARVPAVPIADTEPLAAFFLQQAAPYLLRGRAGNPALAQEVRAAVLFQSVRTHIPPAAHGVVDVLEEFCGQRRQWDLQARWHFWLHSWLWVHLPLSVALVVLMLVHVYVSLKYG